MTVDEQQQGHGVRQVRVEPDQAGQRLDNFLRGHLRGVPKTHVYRIIRKGEVRVNKGRASARRRLEAGDVVRIPPVRVRQEAAAPHLPGGLGETLEGRVVFEDERLLVLNKPSGLAVHGGSGLSYGVIEALRLLRPQAPFLELVHRLDRETSGCLLIAKRRAALRDLHEQLREGRMEKRYLALVEGCWPRRRRAVEEPLQRQVQGGERMVRVSREGRPARTLTTLQAVLGPASLLEVRPVTGRTHQIRVHVAHVGHPVAGDEKYGNRDFNRQLKERGLRRLFLHAASLELRHPGSGQPLRVESPLDPELRVVLDGLRGGEV